MPDLSLILFDDTVAQAWEPFVLTRPAAELRFGALTFRERAERTAGTRCVTILAADHLAGFDEAGAPPVEPLDRAPADGARLFLSSRFVPDWGAPLLPDPPPSGATRLVAGERTVGWYVPPGAAAPMPDALLDPDADVGSFGNAVRFEVAGRLVERIWELIVRTPDQLAVDLESLFPNARKPELPTGVYRRGKHPVILGEGVEIEPNVVLDAREGPIWLDDGARVEGLTRLVGPFYLGRGSAVLGGRIAAASIGPVCKVHGELAESVCLGYVNKQHDGHIGHAYLGRWVNLGAGTTNSDLKNNYGTIRIWTPAGETDTGQIKLGSLLGDHVKTGIGLQLNTGTVVGAGSNLFGAAMPPKYVPPFSWGSGDELVEFRLDKFLEVAERAMGRRKVELGPGMRELLGRAWERARAAAG